MLRGAALPIAAVDVRGGKIKATSASAAAPSGGRHLTLVSPNVFSEWRERAQGGLRVCACSLWLGTSRSAAIVTACNVMSGRH